MCSKFEVSVKTFVSLTIQKICKSTLVLLFMCEPQIFTYSSVCLGFFISFFFHLQQVSILLVFPSNAFVIRYKKSLPIDGTEKVAVRNSIPEIEFCELSKIFVFSYNSFQNFQNSDVSQTFYFIIEKALTIKINMHNYCILSQ